MYTVTDAMRKLELTPNEKRQAAVSLESRFCCMKRRLTRGLN